MSHQPVTESWSAALLDWFANNKRPLPWRSTYAPYHVWISEIMLQQTQMDRGVDYFNRWIRRFPDVASLAAAHEDDVLKLWEGLGYYSRVRNLHKAARIVHEQHHDQLPDTVAGLEALPGIGPYTARAIASIALGQDVSLVDANVERVITRLYDIDLPVKSRAAQSRITALCDQNLPAGQARNFNQALMEFGSLVCTPRNPACPDCPLTAWCRSKSTGTQELRPVPPKKPETVYINMATGVLIHNGLILTQKRRSDDIWGNLWEFPGGVIEEGESPEQAVVREYLEETALHVAGTLPIGIFRHSHTKYRVSLHAYHVELQSDPADIVISEAQEYRWATWTEIRKLAFPAGHRKLIAQLERDILFKARIQP